MTLVAIDWAGATVAHAPSAADATAERWLIDVFEGAPVALRLLVFGGWRLMGARLVQRRAPSQVAGWLIEDAEQTSIRVSTSWRIGLDAQLVLRVLDEAVEITTFVETHTGAARVTWRLIAAIHELIMALLLRGAVRRHVRTPPDASVPER